MFYSRLVIANWGSCQRHVCLHYRVAHIFHGLYGKENITQVVCLLSGGMLGIHGSPCRHSYCDSWDDYLCSRRSMGKNPTLSKAITLTKLTFIVLDER